MVGRRCSSGKAARARPVACARNGVGSIAGEAGAGVMVVGGAVFADERPDVGSNCAAAASADDSVSVSGVLTGGEGRCLHACNRFGGEGNATGRGEQWVRFISWPHELGSCSPEQERRGDWCLAGTGGGSCSRRGTSEW